MHANIYTLICPWRKSAASNPNGACVKCATAELVTSSYSNSGNCVGAASGPDFRTSSHSNVTGDCVGVADGELRVLIGDTKQDGDPDRTILAFAPDVFRAFTDQIKASA